MALRLPGQSTGSVGTTSGPLRLPSIQKPTTPPKRPGFWEEYGKSLKEGFGAATQFGAQAATTAADVTLRGLDFITRETIRNAPRKLLELKAAIPIAGGDVFAGRDKQKQVELQKRRAEIDAKIKPWEEAFDRQIQETPTPFKVAREKIVKPVQEKVSYKPSERWNKAFQQNDWKYIFTKGADETARTALPSALGSLVPVLALTRLPGGTAAVTSIFGASTADEVYEDGVAAGLDPDKARRTAIITGLTVGALERIGAEGVISKPALKVFGRRFGSFLVGAASEGTTESLQEKTQIEAERLFREVGIGEEQARMTLAGVVGAIAGGSLGTLVSQPQIKPTAPQKENDTEPVTDVMSPELTEAGQTTSLEDDINASTTDFGKQYAGIPQEQLYQPDGRFTPQFAETRIRDTAGKLDIHFPGQGMGQKLIESVDPGNISPAGLKTVAMAMAETVQTPQPAASPPVEQTPTITSEEKLADQIFPERVAYSQLTAEQKLGTIVDKALASQTRRPPEVPAPAARPTVTETVTPKPSKKVTLPKEIPETDEYYLLNPRTQGFIQVVGKKAELLPGLDTFTTRNPDGPGFIVVEGKSGVKIGQPAKTPAAAIEAIQSQVIQSGEKLQQSISDAVGISGLSPRYTKAPKTAAKTEKPKKKQAQSPIDIVGELVEMGVNPTIAAKAKPRKTLVETMKEEAKAKAFAGGTLVGTKPSQGEAVAKAVAETPKTAKEVSQETGILEPNVRRILGQGAKSGKFSRIEKGVYILSQNGKDIAYVHTGDAVTTLPKLVADGLKADMVFLDIPYKTPAVVGGNRGIKFDYITPAQFDTIIKAVSEMVQTPDTPVIHMFSQAESGKVEMDKYNQALLNNGFKIVARGFYNKTFKDGSPVTTVRGTPAVGEGVWLLSKSGTVTKPVSDIDLQFTFVRPKGWQSEKPAPMLKKMIELTTPEDGMVVDPFAGSGVTGQQAIATGRRVTLIEKSQEAVEEHIKPKLESARLTLTDQLNEAIKKKGAKPLTKEQQLAGLKSEIPSLVRFVRQKGGMSQEKETALKGELRRLTNKETGSAGIVKSTGKTVDGMLEAVRESGLFPTVTTPSELLDAVESELMGGRVRERVSNIVRRAEDQFIGRAKKPQKFSSAKEARASLIADLRSVAKVNNVPVGQLQQAMTKLNQLSDDAVVELNEIIRVRENIDPSLKKNRRLDGYFDPIERRIALGKRDFDVTLTHELLHIGWSKLSPSEQAAIREEWHSLSESEQRAAIGSNRLFKYYTKSGADMAEEYFSRQGERVYKAENVNLSSRLLRAIREALRWVAERLKGLPKVSDNVKATYEKIFTRAAKLSGEIKVAPKSLRVSEAPDQTLQETFEPKPQKVKLTEIDIPSSPGLLFDKELAIERSVVESGFDPARTQIVLRKHTDGKYTVQDGAAVLRGIQRRLAKGLSAPTEVDVLVNDMTAEKEAEHKWARVDRRELKDEGMTDDVIEALEEIQRMEETTADDLAKNPSKVQRIFNWATGHAKTEMKFTGGLVSEIYTNWFGSPHNTFKEIFEPLHAAERQMNLETERALDKLDKIYKRFKIKPGSKEDKLYGKYVDKNLSSEEAKLITPNIKAFAEAIQTEFTDPHYAAGLRAGMFKQGQYVSGGYITRRSLPKEFTDQFDTSFDDARVNAWFTKARQKEDFEANIPPYERHRQYVNAFYRKLYLEPAVENALAEASQTYRGLQLDDALKYIAYVKEPWKVTGSANVRMAKHRFRTGVTLVKQLLANSVLGLRTISKNFGWAQVMTFKDTSVHYFRAWNMMTNPKTRPQAVKLIKTHFPQLVTEAIPNIHGTFGSPLVGVTKRVSKWQRFTLSSTGQRLTEGLVRQQAALSYYLQGKAMGMTEEQAIQYGHKGVVKSQQIFTPVDMPRAFRGTFGGFVGQFIMPKVKVMNELILDISQLKGGTKQTRYAAARRLARFFIGGALLFSALAALVIGAKKRLTKAGGKYVKGGIEILEGIDPFDMRKFVLGWKEGGPILGFNMVAEQFLAPMVKIAIHMAGGRLPSDQIYNEFKTQNEIRVKDLKSFIPQRATAEDILRAMELQDSAFSNFLGITGDGSSLVNTALGLDTLLDQARQEGDTEKEAKLKREYWEYYPNIGAAKAVDHRLRSMASRKSDRKTSLTKRFKAGTLSEPEYNRKVKALEKEYQDERRDILAKFNHRVLETKQP